MSDFGVKRTCDECPWRRDVAVGRFPPARFRALAETCNPSGSFPQPIFACHKTKDGHDKACAGFLLVVGFDNIAVRLAAATGRLDLAKIAASSPLYTSFAEMARANGVVPPAGIEPTSTAYEAAALPLS